MENPCCGTVYEGRFEFEMFHTFPKFFRIGPVTLAVFVR